MALFNGLVLNSNKKKVTITRDSNNDIDIDVINTSTDKRLNIFKFPVIRGIVNIISILKNSTSYIESSVRYVIDKYIEKNKGDEEIKVTKFEITISYIIAFLLICISCIALPVLISKSFFGITSYCILITIQLCLFAIYLYLLKSSKYFSELFEYHGAEHKVINAYETLDEKDINLESIKKCSRFNKRCGGNLVVYSLFIFAILELLVYHFNLNVILTVSILILLFFLSVGIGYEVLKLFSKLKAPFDIISKPAMFIQYITTKEPTDDKIILASYALKACIRDNTSITLKECINSYIKESLEESNICYELSDIYRIIAHTLNKDKGWVMVNLDYIITYKERIKIEESLNKVYIKSIPLQYVLSYQPFYNEEYFVNENVLIPRADTEVLVSKAIEYINKENLNDMVDMCTGSGCVGISTFKNSNISKVFLVDISKKALEVASINIDKNDCNENVIPICSNLFEFLLNRDDNKKVDIIVSNPPYIETSKICTLDKNVQNEPILALDGGVDGMDFYVKIIEQSKQVLNNGGYLIFEIGYDQLEKITKIINTNKEFEIVESVKDFNGNDRVVVCRFLQK